MPRPTNLVSHDQLLDNEFGGRGTPEREAYHAEVELAVLGYKIRDAREAKGLTQAGLGELIGVGRAQISKLENSVKDTRLSTIDRVFKALGMRTVVRIEEVGG